MISEILDYDSNKIFEKKNMLVLNLKNFNINKIKGLIKNYEKNLLMKKLYFGGCKLALKKEKRKKK